VDLRPLESRCIRASESTEIQFQRRTKNMDPAKDMNMPEGTITFVDDDHIETFRQSYENGKPTDVHTVNLKLARKKK
jgi:ssRNA-specific RNase YbeY (16S rRNA maturation enzyme)